MVPGRDLRPIGAQVGTTEVTVIDIIFGDVYGALITAIALAAAVPYGLWKGAQWLISLARGGADGNRRADR